MLHNSMLVLTSSEKVLQCAICKQDAQLLQLTVMILQTVFRWAECLCHSEHTQCPRFEVRIGEYIESGPESNLIKILLTSRILGKGMVILKELCTSVEHTTATGSLQIPRYDVDYLQQSSRTLMQTLMQIARRFNLPDVRQGSRSKFRG